MEGEVGDQRGTGVGILLVLQIGQMRARSLARLKNAGSSG